MTRPDGTPGVYGVVEVRRPAVFVVALTDADEVVLVTVDRHTVGTSVEVPLVAPTARTRSSPPVASSPRRPAWVAGSWRRVGEMLRPQRHLPGARGGLLATDLREAEGGSGSPTDGDRSGEQARRASRRSRVCLSQRHWR